jgi:hypothetical protein
MLSGLKLGARMWEIRVWVLPLSDFDLRLFAQKHLAYEVESHLLYGARDAVGTNLGARSSDYSRDSHNGIYSWECLEVS